MSPEVAEEQAAAIDAPEELPSVEAHQPDAADRVEAAAADADEAAPDPEMMGLDADAVAELREQRPSSRRDPNRPDPPRT